MDAHESEMLRTERVVVWVVTDAPFALGEATALSVRHAAPSHPHEDRQPKVLPPVGHALGIIEVHMEPHEPTAELRWSASDLLAEALGAVIEHLFEVYALARVVAFTALHDTASQLLLEGAGLRFIAQDGDDLVYYRRAD